MIEFEFPLENDNVSLVKTEEKHFDGLYKVGSNPILWEQHIDKSRWEIDSLENILMVV